MKNACELLFKKYLTSADGRENVFVNPEALVMLTTLQGKDSYPAGVDTLFDISHPEALLIEWIGDQKGMRAVKWEAILSVLCDPS